jgi:hypothetical protein
MDVILWILIILCFGSALAATSRIVKSHRIRKFGGEPSSPIRDNRLRNKRR